MVISATLAASGGVLGIEDLLDRRAVRTVFQPLVHLDTREVVGFECLSRGPAGTELESPLAMLDAARTVGRLQEFDALCRHNALRVAGAATLDPSIAWFVNVEPETAGLPTDDPLDDSETGSGLRVVMEFTERAVANDPQQLLSAVLAARMRSWGVALDDVGAEPGSLALLPLVDPDIVKLDMSLLSGKDAPRMAAVANAVRAHAERTGAVILAEGIENERHVVLARTLGATYGQGWLFGRPGPLPTAVPSPVHAIPRSECPGATMTPTPYEVISASCDSAVTEKSMLMPMSNYLEDQAFDGGSPVVILGCFQHDRFLTPATRLRYARLAGRTAFTAALGEAVHPEPAPGVRGASLHPDDRLCGEWNVVVVGPHYAAALVARDLGDTGTDVERRFEFVITHDRELVLAAARALMHWVVPAPVA